MFSFNTTRTQTGDLTHYSNFVQKFNFNKTPTFSRVFPPKLFLTIFLVKSKLSTAKMPKTTTFSRVFHPQKNRQCSREIKVEFSDKKWRFGTVCKIVKLLFKNFCWPNLLCRFSMKPFEQSYGLNRWDEGSVNVSFYRCSKSRILQIISTYKNLGLFGPKQCEEERR